MDDLRSIERRAGNLRTIRKIVHSLRALSAVQVRRASAALTELREYAERFRLALASLASLGGPSVAAAPPGRRLLVVFGADTGLCGPLTARIAARAARRAAELGPAYAGAVAVGARTADRLAEEGIPADAVLRAPVSMDGIDFTVGRIARRIEAAILAGRLDGVEVVFARHEGVGESTPVVGRVFPVEADDVLPDGEPPPRRPPRLYEPPADIATRVFAEWTVVEVYRAALETLASEHGARLRTTDAASHHLDRRLSELALEANRVRQQAITAEVLEGSRSRSAPDASAEGPQTPSS